MGTPKLSQQRQNETNSYQGVVGSVSLTTVLSKTAHLFAVLIQQSYVLLRVVQDHSL